MQAHKGSHTTVYKIWGEEMKEGQDSGKAHGIGSYGYNHFWKTEIATTDAETAWIWDSKK